MIPILYAKQEQSFTTYGLGLLRDCLSCIVTEEKNGTYELVFKYPCYGKRFSSIAPGCCVRVHTDMGSQLFRIYEASAEINGAVTYRARHISYDLCGYPVEAVRRVFASPPADIVSDALEDSLYSPLPFTAESDITDSILPADVTAALGLDSHVPFSVRALVGAVASVSGAELEWDNLTVRLHAARGHDSGLVVRYGHNMTSFSMTESVESCYTHILPYAAGDLQTVLLDGTVLPLPNADLSVPHVLVIDLSAAFGDGESITPASLLEKTNAYVSAHAADLIRKKVSLSVTCVNPKTAVRVCDMVRVIHAPLGVDVSASVIKTEYDVLGERMERITVGDPRDNLINYVKGDGA